MKHILTLAFAFLMMQSGMAQSKQDIVSCLEEAFAEANMKQLLEEEWGEVNTVYIVSQGDSPTRQSTFMELLNQLAPQDFQGFPYEVKLITEQERDELTMDPNSFGRSSLMLQGNFRDNVLSMNITGPVPGNMRKYILGSFVFEKVEGDWQVIQSHAQVNP